MPVGSLILDSARDELVRGLGGTRRIERALPDGPAIVIATSNEIAKLIPSFSNTTQLPPDGFWLKTLESDHRRLLVVTAANDRGVLYGVFALLRRVALQEPLDAIDQRETPYSPVRWVNQWDNLDGSIERGYGGRSIFFENGAVRPDLSAVNDFARLLASLGINGCAINNVNADPKLVTAEFLPQVARIAAVFRRWGVSLALSVDFSSPKRIGGLGTFDPLNPAVERWWKDKTDEIYRAVPDLGGFVVKADSEGRAGPSAYGRTHADAANVIARALKPHGGLIFYRGFVYDHHMDWRNLKNDRARAAYDNFVPLDGKFDDNAVLQIKHGPIDFQVREPASPLFGALEKTNESVELQITQEYFGQARHLVFLAPMWKEALDFDLQAGGPGTPVKALAAGRTFHRPVGGFVGVSNVGRDENWLGHDLSQANLYAFGRLAWNPDISARQIAEEWTRLTFGNDPQVVETITGMLLGSWRTYENYTGPLGAQTLTDITGNHYGPSVEASERNGWGQWHRADHEGIGMDRTVATGTGFISQYRPPVAHVFESLSECPDELLLFMHHVPYTHRLHSGKTVIQHIYDSHYEGAAAAAQYAGQWRSLQGRIDGERYARVLERVDYQAGHAEVWRDAVSEWFLRTSGIPDERGRVGHHPGRIEAETMELDGYKVIDVQPWEAASGGKAVACESRCSARFQFQGEAGRYDLSLRYFDQNGGVSTFRVFLNDRVLAEWKAADTLPTNRIDAHSSSRRYIAGVDIRPHDVIRIEGIAEGADRAGLDYVEIRRSR